MTLLKIFYTKRCRISSIGEWGVRCWDVVDENHSFLLSLLPTLKKLKDEVKFNVKIELLNVLKKYQTYTQSLSATPLQQNFIPPFQFTPTYVLLQYYFNTHGSQYWSTANNSSQYYNASPASLPSLTESSSRHLANDLDISCPLPV